MDERNDRRYDRSVDTDVASVTVARFKRLSWGAIFAGVVIVLVIQATLSLLGLAFGFGTVYPATERNPAEGLATGAMIWWVVSFLIALFIGGWVTGRLGGAPRRTNGALHGLLTWGVTALVFMFLLTTVLGNIMGGALGILRTGMETTGEVVASSSRDGQIRINTGDEQRTVTWNNIQQELRTLLARGNDQPDAGEISSQTGATVTDQDVEAAVDRLLRSGTTPTQADRDAAVNVLVTRTNMTRANAESTVDRWVSQYNATGTTQQPGETREEQARNVGQDVAEVASSAATWTFVFMILGALAAMFGGSVGAPREDVVVDRA